MTPKEIKALVKTLRSLGVTHYKSGDIEFTLSEAAPAKQVKEKPLTPEEEKEIKHKIEEMASIMRLGDEELVDRMFPDHLDETNEEFETEH